MAWLKGCPCCAATVASFDVAEGLRSCQRRVVFTCGAIITETDHDYIWRGECPTSPFVEPPGALAEGEPDWRL